MDYWDLIFAYGDDGGEIEAVLQLLDRGADVNSQASNGETVLMHASDYDPNINIVRLLLDRGAKINLQEGLGMTALFEASMRGNTEIVELLLYRGALINLQDDNGNTALSEASLKGHTEIVRLLLDKGAELDIRGSDVYRFTALMKAAMEGHTDIVRLLLDKGALIDLQDDDGETALMKASFYGNTDIVKLLLDRGANINLGNIHGQTPLSIATGNGETEIVALIKDHMSILKARDRLTILNSLIPRLGYDSSFNDLDYDTMGRLMEHIKFNPLKQRRIHNEQRRHSLTQSRQRLAMGKSINNGMFRHLGKSELFENISRHLDNVKPLHSLQDRIKDDDANEMMAEYLETLNQYGSSNSKCYSKGKRKKKRLKSKKKKKTISKIK